MQAGRPAAKNRGSPWLHPHHATPDPTLCRTIVATKLQLVCNVVERRCRVCADRRNCTQANHNDKSQHHCIFNCSWSVFRLQKTLYFKGEVLHGISPNGRPPDCRARLEIKRALKIFGFATAARLEIHDNTSKRQVSTRLNTDFGMHMKLMSAIATVKLCRLAKWS